MDRRSFLTNGLTAATVVAMGTSVARAAEPSKVLKIIGISCSPRKGKTTYQALQICLEAAKQVSPAIQAELFELAGIKFDPAVAAGVPSVFGSEDAFESVIQPKLADPSIAGIIIGTPVYFGMPSALCKGFIDRCMVFRKTFALSNKVAGVVAVGGMRNGGQELSINAVQQCLITQEMVLVGDGRPTAHRGATVWNNKDDISTDTVGIETLKNLGRRVAEVVLKLNPAS
jgi:multimeric flavodoxin WrbA